MGDKATLRTMWLWGKEWRGFPEYVSHTLLFKEKMIRKAIIKRYAWRTYAVKSALPEAAREASGESFVLQTAPLWPRKVPIQSPVHSLSIGLPSLQLEMSKYERSSWRAENERWVTGRVWPDATSGVDFGAKDIKKVVVIRRAAAPRCQSSSS